MSGEPTENQESKTKAPTVIIKASIELWDKFGEWMRVHGYQTRPEGFRAAMIQVTNFNNESQQKTTQ